MPRAICCVALAALASLFGLAGPTPRGPQYAAALAPESPVVNAATPLSNTPANTHADDAAIDEMLGDGSGQRQHWTSVPELAVLTSVMDYHAGEPNEYVATDERLSAEATRSLVDDLTLGLRQLTNDTLAQFAAIHYQSVPAGSRVTIVRPKQIVVGRYQGVRRLAHTIGFGGRQARRDGAIFGAAIVLDSEFDRTNDNRRLLRTHELGHALGFNHVKSRVSIMNPRIGPEVTAFDRQVAMLAFPASISRPAQ